MLKVEHQRRLTADGRRQTPAKPTNSDGLCVRRSWSAVSILVLAGLAAFAVTGCMTMQMPSVWKTGFLTAEDDNEGRVAWSQLQGEQVMTAASNDSAFLHLIVRFRLSNEKWTRACAMTGLTAWISPAGQKKKDFGIRFADGPSRESTQRTLAPAPLPLGRVGSLRPRLDRELTITTHGRTIVAPADGSQGPAARFSAQSGVCTYEFMIPIAAKDASGPGLAIASGSRVTVGLTAGLSEEERAAMRQRRMEMRSSEGSGDWGEAGAGGRSGGGRGPGGGRGFGGGSPVVENPDAWLQVQLARPQPSGH